MLIPPTKCVAYTRAPRVGPDYELCWIYPTPGDVRGGWEAPCSTFALRAPADKPFVALADDDGLRLRRCQAVIYNILCALFRSGASN